MDRLGPPALIKTTFKWPNKRNRILARKNKPLARNQDQNDSGVSGVSGIRSLTNL